jgi:hypothetical protein
MPKATARCRVQPNGDADFACYMHNVTSIFDHQQPQHSYWHPGSLQQDYRDLLQPTSFMAETLAGSIAKSG